MDKNLTNYPTNNNLARSPSSSANSSIKKDEAQNSQNESPTKNDSPKSTPIINVTTTTTNKDKDKGKKSTASLKGLNKNSSSYDSPTESSQQKEIRIQVQNDPKFHIKSTTKTSKSLSITRANTNGSIQFSSGYESSASKQSSRNLNTLNKAFFNKSQILSMISPNTFRAQIEKAVREHKVFYIVGQYPSIRNALKKRGWVEKSVNLGLRSSGATSSNALKELDNRLNDEKSDITWANRVLRDYPPDFVWVVRREGIEWKTFNKEQLINRFQRASFTTKVGIAACIQNMHWYCEVGVSEILFPRCYRICNEEERSAFIEDYRLTACFGLLKWLMTMYEKDGEEGVMSPTSRVTSLCVDFAVRQLNNFVRLRKHEDIDWLLPPAFMNQHWEYFLQQYHSVVHGRGKISPVSQADTAKIKYDLAKKTLARASVFWPQYKIDGHANVWICKPGARSRGKGIVLMNSLEKILDLTVQTNAREANWVAQKYMERPMLVYKTKFDIRQWFIVTDWNPLTVWSYKESYIRFCSRPFTLDDFHEQVHLCNNAIQCRYQNTNDRDSSLPDCNMWDNYTFMAHLKMIGKLELWDTQIYPMMKQAILGVLFASQETADLRKNCFELYGADFMLDEELRPWLIEINSCPCMSSSTSVTARLCAQSLEDLVKVVIDKRADKNADTGMYELIYKSPIGGTLGYPINSAADLVVQGKRLTRDVDWTSSKPVVSKGQSTIPLNRSGTASQKTTSILKNRQSTNMTNTTNANSNSSKTSSIAGLQFLEMVNNTKDGNWRSRQLFNHLAAPVSLRDAYANRISQTLPPLNNLYPSPSLHAQVSRSKQSAIGSHHQNYPFTSTIRERFAADGHGGGPKRTLTAHTLKPKTTSISDNFRQPTLAQKSLGSGTGITINSPTLNSANPNPNNK